MDGVSLMLVTPFSTIRTGKASALYETCAVPARSPEGPSREWEHDALGVQETVKERPGFWRAVHLKPSDPPP
jgi:hypothetical protein